MTMREAIVLLTLLAPAAAWAQPEGRPGLAVDAQGRPVVDPTKNVEDLVRALTEKLKELRVSDQTLFDARLRSEREISDAKLKAERELADLRSKYDTERLKTAIESFDREIKLRADFNATIAATEKARVDAIRLVDTGAIAIANERATATANALAKTVEDSRQVLSAQVQRSAEDVRKDSQQQFASIQAQFTPVGTRLTALEQALAEGKGQQRYQDPALAAALAALTAAQQKTDATLTAIATQRAAVTGAGEGQAYLWTLIAGGVGLAILVIGFFMKMMADARARQVVVAPAAELRA
jgi:hypothetical protein